jgi:hypothetical protein
MSLAALMVLAAAFGLAACGGARGAASASPRTVSVFDLRPHECLNPPKANPNFAVASVTVVPCTSAHYDEVYCVLPYSSTPPAVGHCNPRRFAGSLTEDYPGQQALTNFANAACLNEFQPYVGSAYTDSSLYFTYLYPSPRSWDDATKRDRMVVCVIHTTGAPLTRSVKRSRL